jgi:hypothetical protein
VPPGFDGDLTLIPTPAGTALDPVYVAHSFAQEVVDGTQWRPRVAQAVARGRRPMGPARAAPTATRRQAAFHRRIPPRLTEHGEVTDSNHSALLYGVRRHTRGRRYGPWRRAVEERSPDGYEYRLLATSRTSTRQREVLEGVESGWELITLLSRDEHMVVMERSTER